MKRTASPKKLETEDKENTVSQSVSDEFEDAIMVAYQKKEPGEWERIEITYRKKKQR